MQVLVCIEGLSNDDVGVARGIVFQEMRPGATSKTGDFVKEMFGGATVEQFVKKYFRNYLGQNVLLLS